MKLVPDWKEAHKWISVQAFTILAAMPLVWMTLPPDIKSMLPEAWQPWVLTAVAIGGLLGRLKDQQGKGQEDVQDPS